LYLLCAHICYPMFADNTALVRITMMQAAPEHGLISRDNVRGQRMRSTLLPSSRLWTSLFLGLCWLPWVSEHATAQLWDVFKYAQAQDGMTATIGNESVHISVCRSSVIHFVATPEPPNTIRQRQPWMLDSKQSCPGAMFQVSQNTRCGDPHHRYVKDRTLAQVGQHPIQYSTRRESLARAKLDSSHLRTD